MNIKMFRHFVIQACGIWRKWLTQFSVERTITGEFHILSSIFKNHKDVVQHMDMQDAPSLNPIGRFKNRQMVLAALPGIIAVQQMTIVYVLTVLTSEQSSKVSWFLSFLAIPDSGTQSSRLESWVWSHCIRTHSTHKIFSSWMELQKWSFSIRSYIRRSNGL